MDTAKLGHYVNKGPLEFRQVDLDATSSSSSSDDEESNTGGEASLAEEEDDDNLMEIETAENGEEIVILEENEARTAQSQLQLTITQTKTTTSTSQNLWTKI